MTARDSSVVASVEGRALPVRGDDIDTDRIMPARFLRAITFDGLERHVFEDDRASWPSGRGRHPFDDPAYAGASVLVVNRNFGCGASREHAPQGLLRWGIRACVGESFSEIFFGNALAIGLPCVRVSAEATVEVQAMVEARPATMVRVDLARNYYLSRPDISLPRKTLLTFRRNWVIGLPSMNRQSIGGPWRFSRLTTIS